MNLISSASPWISDEPVKKRTSSIRKTIKKTHTTTLSDPPPYEADLEETISYNETRNTKVNQLLEKMTLLNIDNDGDALANFTPLEYPTMDNEIQDSILPKDYNIKRNHENTNFSSDNTGKTMNSSSDFNRVYDAPINRPYYAGLSRDGQEVKSNNKIMDKLSYIVHLLEQQENEKTDNNLEEYILYILLGTFVIFVVDSFSRGGKYVR